MPGKWQIAVLETLAQHRSPLAMQAIHAHCGATNRAERASCKRAVWNLVKLGLVQKRGRGVYAIVINVEALVRDKWPNTEIWKEKPCPPP